MTKQSKKRTITSPLPPNFTAAPLPPKRDDSRFKVPPEIMPGDMFNPDTGEHLGPRGREPTRYGDWESKGRCWDF
jgi:hypothetical protein